MINLNKNQINDFLLSLNLIDSNSSNEEKIKSIYSLSNRIEKNYHVYKIKKRSGGYRTIYAPKPLLKRIQKRILKNILNNKEISQYAKAYHPHINLKDNAYPHLNKKIILKLDIIDFFENINYYQVYSTCFPKIYFPEPVGHLLTYLCTYESRLPQGAPTSAYISNLVLKEFDNEIGNWCKNKHISYTRYSDDMTFSGDFNPREVISFVRKKLYSLNLKINNKKIHVISHSQQQNVTGLIVNQKLQTSSKYRNKIRQEMYYIKKYGLKEHIAKIKYPYSEEKYILSLLGKINYCLSIDNTNKELIAYKDFLKKNDHY